MSEEQATRKRLTREERISRLEQKLAQLKAQQRAAAARARALESKRARALDTRRKILAGAFLLERMKIDARLREYIMPRLEVWLTREDDKALFKSLES